MGGYLAFLPTKRQEENAYLMSFGMFKKTVMGVSKGREQISVGNASVCISKP